MPSFHSGYPPRYFEPKYEGHPSLHSSHHALHPSAAMDIEPDPYDHSKYPSSGSLAYDAYTAYWEEPYSIPHQVAAPVIQPIRIDERYNVPANDYTTSRHRDQPTYHEPPVQDEKITGGVSAQLDYEMEQMIDFVVEMSSGIIRPVTYNKSTFRKWVAQVLNATRLPSATVVLSLSYLAIRIKGLGATGQNTPEERGLYQMLTVALILGSKFLDDNTFQNKSWSEVSNIDVSELNIDERDWLCAFEHRLHHDPDITDGFNSWQKQWESFKVRPVASTASLRPLDVARSHRNTVSPSRYQRQYPASTISTPSTDTYSGRGGYTPRYSPFESWYGQRSGLDSSPSTASHTGPNTPDYYGSQSAWGSSLSTSARDQRYGCIRASPYTKAGWSTYDLPKSSYGIPSMWNSHGQFCQCSTCRYTQPFQPRYGPVMAA